MFFGSVAQNPVALTVVAPYIDRLPGYASAVDFLLQIAARHDIEIQVVTGAPDSGQGTITMADAERLDRNGIDIRIRVNPFVHAKIYYIRYREQGYRAFIGSSNFTMGGFERNDECVAVFAEQRDRPDLERRISNLVMYGAYPLRMWKANPKFRVQTRGAAR
jgi:phosphatidylserine/phosphatidylglycerophosphate/cardiolipin synthase-like enzyme